MAVGVSWWGHYAATAHHTKAPRTPRGGAGKDEGQNPAPPAVLSDGPAGESHGTKVSSGALGWGGRWCLRVLVAFGWLQRRGARPRRAQGRSHLSRAPCAWCVAVVCGVFLYSRPDLLNKKNAPACGLRALKEEENNGFLTKAFALGSGPRTWPRAFLWFDGGP